MKPDDFEAFTHEVCEALKGIHHYDLRLEKVEHSVDAMSMPVISEHGIVERMEGPERVKATFQAATEYGSFRIEVDKYGPIKFEDKKKPKKRKKKASKPIKEKVEEMVDILKELQNI